ncbi:hypothetical protein J2847_006771 [Azospirillum agricola]|nr:hypothetical protein [Azospirillum agricola]
MAAKPTVTLIAVALLIIGNSGSITIQDGPR